MVLIKSVYTDSEDEIVIPRRTKRAHVPVSKKQYENRKRRMKGQEYLGFSSEPKLARVMGPTCSSSFCSRSKVRHCDIFNEEMRTNIFNSFWNFSWEGKKVFIKSHVFQIPCTRRRISDSRKHNTFIFKLPLKHKCLKVCRRMFLSTLSLKSDMIKGWVMPKDKSKYFINIEKKLVRAISAGKQFLKAYFTKLDKMESHYCRKDSKKIYIAAAFKTKADIYKDYVNKCSDEGIDPVSIFTFSKYFAELNLALFKPRKDQCDICVGFKAHHTLIQEYNAHILKKERAHLEKHSDKVAAKKGRSHVFTMDVQAVKLCPNINASAIYFKQRLQVHNFTIYNLASHQCTNYWWSEIDGDLSASTFISIIVYHLKTHCSSDSLPIVIYSDGCGYQNRNHILSNALSIFAIENKRIIEQKYLEKGHTQMECDSAHACIERKLKNQEIYLPIDYLRVTKEARKTVIVENKKINLPFEAIYLRYNFFYNYNDVSVLRFQSIRPGKKKNDPTVSDLRSLQYLPDGSVKYKTDFNSEYTDLPHIFRKYNGYKEPKALHTEQLQVQPSKWKHLQALKPVIPPEYHNFYDNINQ